ncbi:hypothetical protein M2244_002643 [Rhodoferax antarcticus]|nr:hypothetical protein [Rhodoferax antarcticus]
MPTFPWHRTPNSAHGSRHISSTSSALDLGVNRELHQQIDQDRRGSDQPNLKVRFADDPKVGTKAIQVETLKGTVQLDRMANGRQACIRLVLHQSKTFPVNIQMHIELRSNCLPAPSCATFSTGL